MNKNDMFICLYYLSFIQNPYFYILIQVELNCLCSLKLKKKPPTLLYSTQTFSTVIIIKK